MSENNLHEFPSEKRTNTRLAIAGISLLLVVVCFSLFLWVTREKQKLHGDYQAKSTVPTNSTTFKPSTATTGNVVGGTTELAATTPVMPKNESPSCMCDPNALTTAVIDRIYETGFNDSFYDDSTDVEDYNRMQKQLDKLKRYASQVKDTCLQSKYESILALYQRDHDKGLDKLKHPEASQKSELETYEEKQQREVDKCKREGTVPVIRGISK